MRRFSLQTFLLVVMLCAALLALGLVQFRYRKLETEVVRLRKEVGHLGTIDPDRINIIQVPTPAEPLVWKWRIYVPPGTKCDRYIQFNGIPENGIPDFTGGCSSTVQFASTEEGELITVAAVAGPDGRYSIHFTGGDSGGICGGQPIEVFTGNGSTMTLGGDGVLTLDCDKPIVLIKRRLMEPTGPGSYSTPKGDARGFMIWLVPHPKP